MKHFILSMCIGFALGCTLFGQSIKPESELVQKLATDLRQARKEVNDIKESYSATNSTISKVSQRLEMVETRITTISNQVSTIETKINNINTPFKEYALWIIIGLTVWELLKIVKAAFLAWWEEGSTAKNLIKRVLK